MKATLPAKSFPMLALLERFSLPIFVKIAVEIHLEPVVDDIRGHHQPGESGQGHDLVRIEESSYLIKNFFRDSAARLRHGPSECDQCIPLFIEVKLIGALAPID